MTNAWSLLYDELMITSANSDDYNDFWEQSWKLAEQSIDYTYNISTAPVNDDKITFNIPQMDLITESKGTPWKYNEEEIVKELLEYIRGTYKQHYAANDENIQTLDFIEAAHKDGEAFCRDNILKYTSRYDKKGTADRDIMKIQHYSVLLKFFRNKNNNRETYPQ